MLFLVTTSSPWPHSHPETPLPKRNYGFEKRQKELAKQRKREEKRQRRAERKASDEPDPDADPDTDSETDPDSPDLPAAQP
jgi:hypothetical protein